MQMDLSTLDKLLACGCNEVWTSVHSPSTQQEVDIAKVHREWHGAWVDHLALIVEEYQDTPGTLVDTPGVEFWELATAKYSYEACPQAALRKMRRLFRRFRIESFVENRSYADYRNVVEQELREVDEESRSTRLQIADATHTLESLLTHLKPYLDRATVENASEQVRGMLKALETARVQILAIDNVLQDKRFQAHLFELLRKLHEEVQERWGTWPRRLNTPLVWMLAFFLIAAGLYALTGAATGSQILLPAAALLPLCAFAIVYYSGRNSVLKLIEECVRHLAVYDPEPPRRKSLLSRVWLALRQKASQFGRRCDAWAKKLLSRSAVAVPNNWSQALLASFKENFRKALGSASLRTAKAFIKPEVEVMTLAPKPAISIGLRKPTIWHGDGDLALQEMYQKTYTAVVDRHRWSLAGIPGASSYQSPDAKVRYRGWVLAGVGVLAAVLVIPLRAFITHGKLPTFAVDSATAGGVCRIARGYVLWPGPIEVVLLEDSKLTMIPRDRVARISMWSTTPPGPPCEETIAPPVMDAKKKGSSDSRSTAAAELDSPGAFANLYLISNVKGPDRGVLVVPFPTPPLSIHCGFTMGQSGVAVETSMIPVLKRVGSALQECGRSGRSPIIDVRGFASSIKFTCPGDKDSNLDLAHARRSNVLSAMFEKRRREKGDQSPWRPSQVTIQPSAAERWTSLQHMNDFSLVGDLPEIVHGGTEETVRGANVSQRVEVWFHDLGTCTQPDLKIFAR
jgi:hypothetical protein